MIRSVGTYADATRKGHSTREIPHVLVQIGGGHQNGARFYGGVSVTTVGRWADQHRRALRVYDRMLYGGDTTDNSDVLVAEGLAHVDAAIK